jgi:lysophospholipase L1-like esterase
MRLLGFVLTLLLLSVGAFVAGRESAPNATASYIPRRAWILEESAKRTPPGAVLLVGDSLSERSGLTSLCGRPVFNAGISSATLHDVAALAARLKGELAPERVFVAIGTNDARVGTDPDAFEREYRALVAGFAPLPVVLVPIPAVGEGAVVSPEAVAALNRRIARVPAARRLDQFAVPTVDGVHPTIAGAAQWREQLARACV